MIINVSHMHTEDGGSPKSSANEIRKPTETEKKKPLFTERGVYHVQIRSINKLVNSNGMQFIHIIIRIKSSGYDASTTAVAQLSLWESTTQGGDSTKYCVDSVLLATCS